MSICLQSRDPPQAWAFACFTGTESPPLIRVPGPLPASVTGPGRFGADGESGLCPLPRAGSEPARTPVLSVFLITCSGSQGSGAWGRVRQPPWVLDTWRSPNALPGRLWGRPRGSWLPEATGAGAVGPQPQPQPLTRSPADHPAPPAKDCLHLSVVGVCLLGPQACSPCRGGNARDLSW